MAKTILVFDELDSDLGPFFQSCINHLDDFFNETQSQYEILKSAELNELSVKEKTTSIGKFVFAAYSHGNNDCLLNSKAPYISTTINNTCFKDSFFYTFSCKAGHELGGDLVKNGCLCFIGYKRPVSIWSTYLQPFVECANHGLIQFFKGNDTPTVFVQMDQKYNDEIDAIYEENSMVASILRYNRDSLVIQGKNIDVTQF